MEVKYYQKEGYWQTLVTAVLVIALALSIHHQKTLLVHETGNISLFGEIGILLAIGMLLKWAYSDRILACFSLLGLAFSAGSFFLGNGMIVEKTFLFMALSATTYFLMISPAVKNYIYGQSNKSESGLQKRFYQQEGFWITLLTAVLIVVVSYLTLYKKTLFVEESGKFLVFGDGGVFMAIGLLLKWRYIRRFLIVGAAFGFFICVVFGFDMANPNHINYMLLGVLLFVILYLLLFADSVKKYLYSDN